jgi:hypothetical protein
VSVAVRGDAEVGSRPGLDGLGASDAAAADADGALDAYSAAMST